MEQLFQDPTRTGQAEFRDVSGSYFAAMHIPLLEGRTFDDRDGPDAVNVAVVSASLAKARWPRESPIGKWVEFGNMDGDLQPLMIVGVVGDIREMSLDAAGRPTFYANYAQRPLYEQMFIVLDGARRPAAVTASVQSIVRTLRPDVPPRVQTMGDIVAASLAGRRLALVLVGAFGVAALLLSACGLYGIISYFVTQRAQELTIRIALGASRQAIVALVLREGSALTLAGLVVGAAAALAATRVLARLLYGVGAADPIAFGSMMLLVAAVALAASWVPAYRAARADALEVLRAG
jgi:putative ABC transport system permease protein